MTATRIEACRRCAVSFDLVPGEATVVLVHRYTEWREAHAHAETSPDAPLSASERLARIRARLDAIAPARGEG